MGAQIAVPVPRFSTGPFDVTSFGMKNDPVFVHGIVYRVTVANRGNSAMAFDLAGGSLG
jgi:hypothetical protein